jgi:hypothetical protein
MDRCLLVCSSVTYAQRAKKQLNNKGIYAAIIKTPSEASLDGCHYAVSINKKDLTRAVKILNEMDLAVKKIYLSQHGEIIEEMRL